MTSNPPRQAFKSIPRIGAQVPLLARNCAPASHTCLAHK